ncbi:MAG: hypothetical protein AAB879_01065 [Patescibacteria group bacterium]
MNTSHPHQLGLVLGGTLGAVHVLWSLLVAFGLAHTLIGWSLRLHFLKLQVSLAPFDLMTAVGLVIVTSLIGYVIGYLVGVIWNRVTTSS